ncbi:MAG: hypothetical protein ABIO02_01990, partial [Patescibacteria group bacterium]
MQENSEEVIRDHQIKIPSEKVKITEYGLDSVLNILESYDTDKKEQLQFLKPEDEVFDRNFENLADYNEWAVKTRLGIYPDSHLVTQYAQSLLEKCGG